ncbi:MAG: hypothetical protein ACLQJR_32290 [Stellaceae bacterium]
MLSAISYQPAGAQVGRNRVRADADAIRFRWKLSAISQQARKSGGIASAQTPMQSASADG